MGVSIMHPSLLFLTFLLENIHSIYVSQNEIKNFKVKANCTVNEKSYKYIEEAIMEDGIKRRCDWDNKMKTKKCK